MFFVPRAKPNAMCTLKRPITIFHCLWKHLVAIASPYPWGKKGTTNWSSLLPEIPRKQKDSKKRVDLNMKTLGLKTSPLTTPKIWLHVKALYWPGNTKIQLLTLKLIVYMPKRPPLCHQMACYLRWEDLNNVTLDIVWARVVVCSLFGHFLVPVLEKKRHWRQVEM